jgi:hypothetical protein
MKKYKLGYFYGETIFVETDNEFLDSDKKAGDFFEHYLESIRRMAVDEYRSNCFISEIDKKLNESKLV